MTGAREEEGREGERKREKKRAMHQVNTTCMKRGREEGAATSRECDYVDSDNGDVSGGVGVGGGGGNGGRSNGSGGSDCGKDGCDCLSISPLFSFPAGAFCYYSYYLFSHLSCFLFLSLHCYYIVSIHPFISFLHTSFCVFCFIFIMYSFLSYFLFSNL